MFGRRATLASILACSAALPARALRLEEADAETTADLGLACDRSTVHQALEDHLRAVLQGGPLPSDLEQMLLRLSSCPFCGCRLALVPPAAS